MKKREIMEAYDNITPTDEQRERMLHEILRNKRRKQSEAFNPLPIVAALTLVFCIWRVTEMDWREGIPQGELRETVGQPEVTGPEETFHQEEETLLPDTAILLSDNWVTFMEIPYYNRILKKYHTAIQDEWDEARCKTEGISPVFASYVRTQPEKLCFSYPDLDGNGTEELVISDGTLVFDIYTVVDDEAKSMAQLRSTGEIMYLLEDGQFIHYGPTDWMSYDHRYTRYGFSEGRWPWTVKTLFEKNGTWYQENGMKLDPDMDPMDNDFIRKDMDVTSFLEYHIAKGLSNWFANLKISGVQSDTEENFGVLYLPSQEDGTEASLQLLVCTVAEGEAYLTHSAYGDFSDRPIALNHIQIDGKHVYFGTMVGTYPDAEGNDCPLSLCAGFFVTDSEGNTTRVVHNPFHQLLLFVMDSPLSDFQLKVGDTVIQDYAGYLKAGLAIREAVRKPIMEDEDTDRIAQIEEEVARHREQLEYIEKMVQKKRT